jgi:hypothetical protein
MFIENGKLTGLGIATVVVTSVAAGYCVQKFLFSNEKGFSKALDEANEKNADLTAKVLGHEAEKAVVNSKIELSNTISEINCKKLELEKLQISNERKSIDAKADSLSKQEQELSNERKALSAMERRLKLEVVK